MPILQNSLVDLLSVVFQNSWQGSVLIFLILVVQWVFRKQLTAPWRYSLWFLLLVRLAMPLTPPTTFSLFNWVRPDVSFAHGKSKSERSTEARPAGQLPHDTRDGPFSQNVKVEKTDSSAAPLTPSSATPYSASSHTRWREKALQIVVWGWLVGIVVLIGRVAIGTFRLSQHVRSVRPITDSSVLVLLEDCKQLMGVSTPLIIIQSPRIKTPMMYGFVRPRLLLPDGLIERFTPMELRFVFLHELAHLKRGDILVNWLATVLQILHWINPLVWIAFWRMRADREVACDSLVLRRTERENHPNYASTVVKLLEGFARPVSLPSLLGILETTDDIKQRLRCIADFRQPRGWSFLGTASASGLALLTLTDSQRPSAILLLSTSAGLDQRGTWYRCASGPTQNGPSARIGHSTVWTGKEMIVWGGGSASVCFSNGGRYELATDTWRPIALSNAPSPRWLHAAVWTGREMIIWGGRTGFENFGVKNDGARYDPVTDTWSPLSTANAPAARSQMTAVWTGKEMLIWGGAGEGWVIEALGARYDPHTDTWKPMGEIGAPEARMEPCAVWTGKEMIVWGGVRYAPDQITFNTGGRYDPTRDRWVLLPTNGAPAARTGHTGVWTGSEMIIWGGHEDMHFMDSGARFSVARNTWIPTTLVKAPQRRMGHSAVWTGSEMIIWGGQTSSTDIAGHGARYDPYADKWQRLTNIGAPAARFFQRDDGAVWTSRGMLIFGGGTGRKEFDTIYLWSPSYDLTFNTGML